MGDFRDTAQQRIMGFEESQYICLLPRFLFFVCVSRSEHHVILFPGVRTEPVADLSWRWTLVSPWSLLQVGMWCPSSYSKCKFAPATLSRRQPRCGHHLQIWMQTRLLCDGECRDSRQEVSVHVFDLKFPYLPPCSCSLMANCRSFLPRIPAVYWVCFSV